MSLQAASLLLGASFLQSYGVEAAAGASDLSTLPWDDLRASLSDDASLVETGPDDYISQCLPVFPLADEDRSHYDLVDQPSGTCMNQLFCGFERCNPVAHETNMSIHDKWDVLYAGKGITYAGMASGTRDPPEVATDPSNPSYDIPNYVLFPAVAGDVHAAVAFAKEHGIELSVKNSGHSYTGASTKADTLHLNMNRYQQYSNVELVDCIAADADADDPTLAKQPCRLALARKKEATLRIGGGENWDKVYHAVKDWNEASPDGYKYLAVGATAGTVSPMGWTWSAGLSGSTNGRTNGFGVDQVLQIEMVLPLGHHVKFGPVEWEEVEGYRYPRTTKVHGVCNSNPSGDDSEWVWRPCADSIDFDGLWFAQNGGGGGTYGIVTSVHVQLSEYFPVTRFDFGSGILASEQCGVKREEVLGAPLGNVVWEFVIDYWLNPSTLGISDEDSDLCGAPALVPTAMMTCCYGDGADIMLSTWKKYIADRNQTLIDAGVSPISIEAAATCFDYGMKSYKDYLDSQVLEAGPHAGKALSEPKPSYTSTTEATSNILIPAEWIVQNKAKVAAWLNEGSVDDSGVASVTAPSVYLAFGGGTTIAHDQANSLSDAHRSAGLMLFFPHGFLDEAFWMDLFPEMYPAVTEGSNFPAFVGANHAGPNTRGPTKDDWTKPCSLDLTEEERDANCVPLQEAIWGTENLVRLEAIKGAVDPNGMLNCYGCVGNNRMRHTDTETTLVPTVAPPTSAGLKQTTPLIGSVVLGLASFLSAASFLV